jgi:uncharacterized protein (DUF983 family)
MITKGHKLYSVLHQKCPRCHEGDMFKHASFSLQFAAMHRHCPHCGLDFIQEPSFYFGAMYVSYAIQVVIFVGVYLGLRYTINPDTSAYVIGMIAGALLILPLTYRWSRLLWINVFISYRKSSQEPSLK